MIKNAHTSDTEAGVHQQLEVFDRYAYPIFNDCFLFIFV